MTRIVCLLGVLAVAAGCGGGPKPIPDGGMPDAPPDVAPDAPADLAPDTPADLAPDLAPDAPADLAPDAPVDLAPDAPADLAPEVAPDAADGPSSDVPADVPPPVCGNRKLEAGETCDYGNNGEFCKQCQVTCLGNCPWPRAPDTCAALTGDDQISCLALLNCMAVSMSQCAYIVFNGISGPSLCYCTDATCSKGADGPCAREFQAVAKTTDSAEILRQINDPTTTIAGVSAMAKRYGMSSFCTLGCRGQP